MTKAIVDYCTRLTIKEGSTTKKIWKKLCENVAKFTGFVDAFHPALHFTSHVSQHVSSLWQCVHRGNQASPWWPLHKTLTQCAPTNTRSHCRAALRRATTYSRWCVCLHPVESVIWCTALGTGAARHLRTWHAASRWNERGFFCSFRTDSCPEEGT